MALARSTAVRWSMWSPCTCSQWAKDREGAGQEGAGPILSVSAAGQMGAILVMTAAILTLLTRQQVTPLANPKLPQRDRQPDGGPSPAPAGG
jgi:hypothetical protein